MFDTNLYRTQHKRLVSMVEELRPLLEASILVANAPRVRSLLAQLASTLTVHLYLEDTELYPQLRDSPSPELRVKAKQYQDEMGGVMVLFKDYLAKYSSTALIQNSPDAFVQETQLVIQAITRRIEAEETDFFVLLDGLP